MLQKLLIRVEIPDKMRAGQFKCLYRHSIDLDTSLQLPVQKIYDGLCLLYPDSVITFSIG